MAVDALRIHQERQSEERLAAGVRWSDHDLVFCTRTGAPLDAANVRREFRAACKAAKIGEHWTPRELRHSFVSLMLELRIRRGTRLRRPHRQRQRGRCHGDLRARQSVRGGRRPGRADRRAPPARHDRRMVTGMAAVPIDASPVTHPCLRGPVPARTARPAADRSAAHTRPGVWANIAVPIFWLAWATFSVAARMAAASVPSSAFFRLATAELTSAVMSWGTLSAFSERDFSVVWVRVSARLRTSASSRRLRSSPAYFSASALIRSISFLASV